MQIYYEEDGPSEDDLDNLIDTVESFVDEPYKLDQVLPIEEKILEYLRERFKGRETEQIPYYEISMALYAAADKKKFGPYKFGHYKINHLLRHLWRAGLIRRFVEAYNPSTIHNQTLGTQYILYPGKVKRG